MSTLLGPTFTGALEAGVAASGIVAVVYWAWMRPAVLHERRSTEALQGQLERDFALKSEKALLDAKEESLKLRDTLEKDYRAREEKLGAKEEALEARRENVQERESLLHSESRALAEHRSAVERRATVIQEELQRVAKLNREQAKEILLKEVEAEFRQELVDRVRSLEAQADIQADRQAKKYLLDQMQRIAAGTVSEASITVVELPSEDMKGRIIGREGRNIRAFEQITGVDLLIDDTPEAVVLSCFDPIRRETARMTLQSLMADGRIHPTRIEELFEQSRAEIERMILESGERAAERAGITGLPAKVLETMGRLRYRFSLAQNVLDHSVEVARLCAGIAAECGLSVEVSRRAGFLHDIGKGLGPEWEGPHAITGMNFLKQAGEKEAVLLAVGAHHYDIDPSSPEAVLVIVSDTVSASRPGARRESYEGYIKRLADLEALANSFPGVERSYAVQAGREVRIIVSPTEIDDLGARRLAKDVAKRVSAEVEGVGSVKVTVIRETRVTEMSK